MEEEVRVGEVWLLIDVYEVMIMSADMGIG